MLARTVCVRVVAVLLVAAVLSVPHERVTPEAAAANRSFTPARGVTFNNPMGDGATKRRIVTKLMKSINHSPRGSEIDIFSWNFLTSQGTRALLKAQRRGVRVRVLMDDANLENIDNRPFRQLRKGLSAGNKGRAKARRSWARVCVGTCRSKGGAAHSKYYLFSKVGKARWVYIQGSANFTNAAAHNQWNDIYTHRGNKKIYRWALRSFNQAAKDKPVKPPYQRKKFGKVELIMFPATGRKTKDPVMGLLNGVKCTGATNTASKRTVIRLAPDVMRQARGMRLGKKLRSLWEQGCDVKIGYTVMGIDVGRMLRAPGGRGPVPVKHLAIDSDYDGQFDKYFHLKAMTIVGNVRGKRNNHVVLNGSANWSGLAKVSDENLGIYWQKRLTLRYEEHLNYWYDNFDRHAAAARSANSRFNTLGVSPERDQRLVFGSGRNAVYEDGEPVSTDGTDPFALVEH